MRQNSFGGGMQSPIGAALGNLTKTLFAKNGNAWDRDAAMAQAGYFDSQADKNYAAIDANEAKVASDAEASGLFGSAIKTAFAPRPFAPQALEDTREEGMVGPLPQQYAPPTTQQVLGSAGDMMGQYARLNPEGAGKNFREMMGTLATLNPNANDTDRMAGFGVLNQGKYAGTGDSVSPEGQVTARGHEQSIEDVKFKIAQENRLGSEAVAKTGADARLGVAEFNYKATTQAAITAANGAVATAKAEGASDEEQARIAGQSAYDVAKQQGANEETAQKIAAEAQKAVAITKARASVKVAGIKKASDLMVSENLLTGSLADSSASMKNAETAAGASTYGADKSAEASMYGADQSLAGEEVRTAGSMMGEKIRSQGAENVATINGTNATDLNDNESWNLIHNAPTIHQYALEREALVGENAVRTARASVKPPKPLGFGEVDDITGGVLSALGIPYDKNVDEDPTGEIAKIVARAGQLQPSIGGPSAIAQAVSEAKSAGLSIDPPNAIGGGGYDVQTAPAPKSTPKSVSPISITKKIPTPSGK